MAEQSRARAVARPDRGWRPGKKTTAGALASDNAAARKPDAATLRARWLLRGATLMVLVAVATSSFSTVRPAEAIVNGEPANAADVPFVARLVGSNACGATFLTDEWLATAAHCVARTDPSTLAVVYGLTNPGDREALNADEQQAHVRKVAAVAFPESHESWPVLVDDVALIRLAAPADPGTMTTLPLYDASAHGELPAGTDIQVYGWGSFEEGSLTQSPTLNQTSLAVIEGCADLWVSTWGSFCALNNETSHCAGDSGGPATVTIDGATYLAGIASFGAPGCPIDKPAGYADVAAYTGWFTTYLFGFRDVDPNGWEGEPVAWLHKHGITRGCGGDRFCPDRTMTREEQVTFLHRYAGKPVASESALFPDVSAESYYSDAVNWAFSTGVTQGVGGGQFGTGRTVTRGEAVTFLWRLAGEPAPTRDHPFRDVDTDRYFADAVAWAAEVGVTTGFSPARFGPEEPVTRAQFAAFLARFDAARSA